MEFSRSYRILCGILGVSVIKNDERSLVRLGLIFVCISCVFLYLLFGAWFIRLGWPTQYIYCAISVAGNLLGYWGCRNHLEKAMLPVGMFLNINTLATYFIVTHSFGECGMVLIVFASVMGQHLFPVFRKRLTLLIVDIMNVLLINLIFIYGIFTPPQLTPPSALVLLLLNAGVIFSIVHLSLTKLLNQLALHGERNRADDALTRLQIDPLTGLGNRNMLEQRRADFSSDPSEQNQPYCVAIADIDFFKKINDTYGHDAGDAVLKWLAQLMQAAFRKSDLLIRWGGEEFLMILFGSNLAVSRMLLERLQKNLSESVCSHDGIEIRVTITVGLCQSDGSSEIESLITHADRLLYAGKKAGRNRIVTENDITDTY